MIVDDRVFISGTGNDMLAMVVDVNFQEAATGFV